MSYTAPIQPIKASFGEQANKDLEKYVWERITSISNSTSVLREQKLKKWRRLIKGRPASETKSFPWENASNVVIQIIGTCTDILQAAVMGSVWSTLPIYNAQLVGEWDEKEQGEEQRSAIEAAMNYFASEPSELDLMRVESLWFHEAIGIGTSFTKSPYEWMLETQVVGMDSTSGEPIEREFLAKYGPMPEKLPFEDFGVDPKASTLESADFKYHIRRLKKWDLLDRAQRGIYDKAAVDKIVMTPDRFGASDTKEQQLQDQSITLSNASIDAEWDIYECWLEYYHNSKKYKLVYTYHYKSRTTIKAVFNFYPDNDNPFRMARLAWDEDGIYGYGFAEMLEHYQEEISTGHNQRCDNRTLGNTSVLRVSRVSKLDSNFSIFPLATIPGEKDEIDVMQLGSNYPPDIQGEQLSISLAERRAGVEMGVSGAGGGTANPKKGVYSAMGTFAVMQAGNKRNNMRTMNMRYAHIELGRLILKLYSHFGLGEKGKIFGKQQEFLIKALTSVKEGRLGFPIRAATESINKELEKQNNMLLVNVVKQHHMGIAQILQSIAGPGAEMMPPELKQYLMQTIKASDYLMHDLLKSFEKNDPERLLPLPSFVKGATQGGATEQGTEQPTGGNLGTGNLQQVGNIPFSGISSSSSGLPEVSGVPQ